MSLIQSALDQAEQPDPIPNPSPKQVSVPVTPKPEVIQVPKNKHDEPRLNAIRFYEAANQTVEHLIRENISRKAPVEATAASEDITRRNFLILILGLIAVSLIVSRFMIPSPKSETGTAEEVKATTSAAIEKPQAVIVQSKLASFSKPAAQAKFLLTGITAAEDTPLAVINNQVVGTGDHLREGATVKSITEKRVVLEMDGKQIVLNF